MRFYYKSTDIDFGATALSSLFGSGVTPSVPPSESAHVLEYVYLPSSSDGSTPYNTGYKFEYSPYGMIRLDDEVSGNDGQHGLRNHRLVEVVVVQ